MFLIFVIFKLKKEKHAVDLIINHHEHDTKAKIHLFFFVCLFMWDGMLILNISEIFKKNTIFLLCSQTRVSAGKNPL